MPLNFARWMIADRHGLPAFANNAAGKVKH